jgi:hypothetical protein
MKTNKKMEVQRQAVIVIHGIGEQKPMDTLQDFVNLVAPEIPRKKDPHGKLMPPKKKFFNKPDVLSETYELRRLTANAHKHTFKTDYFEYYWAYKMNGTKISDIIWWVREILWRRPGNIPARIRWIYQFFWASISIGFLIAGLFMYFHFADSAHNPVRQFIDAYTPPFVRYFATGIWLIVNWFLIYFLGDAVRYMTPRTGNIQSRQDIRQTGINLLTRLHEARITIRNKDGSMSEKNKYDRIILVGHSLGSVIAYDLITFLWTKHNEKISLSPAQIETLEQLTDTLQKDPTKENREAYRKAQFEMWASQYTEAGSWRISDFITLGSPLAHAELLLAGSPAQLNRKQAEREFPTCPPVTEYETKFHFSVDGADFLHHAAPFALTRWTNLSFRKDFVGGNICAFGPGIENHYLKSESVLRNSIPFLSHTTYWHPGEPGMLKLIREKLQLRITKVGDSTEIPCQQHKRISHQLPETLGISKKINKLA